MALPPSADLSSQCPPVYDQGQLGSCTANAGAGLAEFLTMKLGMKDYMPCRLAIYYWERVIDGTVSTDSGASLSDCLQVLSTNGAPNEALMPYDVNNFTQAPSQNVISNGQLHVVGSPLQVNQDANDMKAVIASGYPFVFGFTVYESFESDAVANTGIMPMPALNEQIVGGHAVMAVGYDDSTGYFKIRNSWGSDWGQNGYFLMPYEYILNSNLADDMWTSHSITGWKPHILEMVDALVKFFSKR
jgi:C1A family cysteine protease